MRHQQINRISSRVLIVLTLVAMVTVFSGFLQPPQPRDPDEGTAAHIFQLSIVAAFPTILLFFATADWQKPLRALRPLLLPAALLAFSFASLYYLEHRFYVQHFR